MRSGRSHERSMSFPAFLVQGTRALLALFLVGFICSMQAGLARIENTFPTNEIQETDCLQQILKLFACCCGQHTFIIVM